MLANLARASVLWAALTCVTACGVSASGPPAGSVAQSEAGAGGEAGVSGDAGMSSTTTCPNGDLPGSDLATTCPGSLPEAGSCCGRVGVSCTYPGDEASHVAALCIDDSVHPLFWGQTAVLDRLACSASDKVTPFAMTGAACSSRQTEPCAVHDLITPQELLNEQFATVVEGCGGPPEESSLEAEFEAGCATGLFAQLAGVSNYSALLGCVEEALAARHFSCADDLGCARVERSTLPR